MRELTRIELGYLLLCAELPDAPEGLHPLHEEELAQLRQLPEHSLSEREAELPLSVERLRQLGLGRRLAERTVRLLERTDALRSYLERAEELQIDVLTARSPGYPTALRSRLGSLYAPVLFLRGDTELLSRRGVSLVGSRELCREGEAFARRVGQMAAREGYVLISGNARGADQLAQQACLEAGGAVVSVVSDALRTHSPKERILYVSERGWDLPFTSARAKHRNRVIHGLGVMSLVAQTACGTGGTWSGTADALKCGLRPIFVRNDGSPGTLDLLRRGALPVETDGLLELTSLLAQG